MQGENMKASIRALGFVLALALVGCSGESSSDTASKVDDKIADAKPGTFSNSDVDPATNKVSKATDGRLKMESF
jgi:TRAP-type C4-dicarboxylate transport system substrate-binding protein